jgi:putative sterol carrier protein
MTDLIASATAALKARLPAFDDGTVKFAIPGEGAIMVGPAGVWAADDAADVTLTATAEVFQDILGGNLKPMTAFMSGKLSIEGSISLAMRLGTRLA